MRLIDVDALIDNTDDRYSLGEIGRRERDDIVDALQSAPTIEPFAQVERLSDDDFETIRIHLSAHKEKLCNQGRWKEAEEYQRIIDRFMAFALEENHETN